VKSGGTWPVSGVFAIVILRQDMRMPASMLPDSSSSADLRNGTAPQISVAYADCERMSSREDEG